MRGWDWPVIGAQGRNQLAKRRAGMATGGDKNMAKIVVMGAGLGGMPMAFEMQDLARKEDSVTVISDKDYFHFVPSNPWVAVDWRQREDIVVPLEKPLKKKKIDLILT